MRTLKVGEPITKDLLLSLINYPVRSVFDNEIISLNDNNTLLVAVNPITFILQTISLAGFHVRLKNLAEEQVIIYAQDCVIDDKDTSIVLEPGDSVHLATDGNNWFILSAGFVNTSDVDTLRNELAELQQDIDRMNIRVNAVTDKQPTIRVEKGATLTPEQQELLRNGGFVIYTE